MTKKEQVNKIPKLELKKSNSKECKIKAIYKSEVYTKKLDRGQLLGLHYLVY